MNRLANLRTQHRSGAKASISILLPTRKRPSGFRRMYDSAMATASNPESLEVSVYVDDDDHETQTALSEWKLPNVLVTVGPRVMFSNMWNLALKRASAEIIMLAGDDAVFRSSGWDALVKAEFETCPDKILIVHGRDGCLL